MPTAQTGPPEGSRPIPDPTLLTTEALQREIKALRELLEQRFGAAGQLSDAKLSEVRAQLEGHQAFDDERFKGVDGQLQRTEALRIEQKEDTARSIQAALLAQQDAAAKSERATEKQLAEIKTTIDRTVDGLRREIADMKERLSRAESSISGG